MPELDFYKMSLDNWIAGMEISKSAEPVYWTDHDEQQLKLLKGVRDLLGRIEVKKEGAEQE